MTDRVPFHCTHRQISFLFLLVYFNTKTTSLVIFKVLNVFFLFVMLCYIFCFNNTTKKIDFEKRKRVSISSSWVVSVERSIFNTTITMKEKKARRCEHTTSSCARNYNYEHNFCIIIYVVVILFKKRRKVSKVIIIKTTNELHDEFGDEMVSEN